MHVQVRNNSLVLVYTWFVLRLLDQHQEEFMEGRTTKIGDLALHKEMNGPGDGRRAAGALAMPLMNLYSALSRAALESGVTEEQATQMVVDVLLDRDKTVTDLAEVFGICYQPPQIGGPA